MRSKMPLLTLDLIIALVGLGMWWGDQLLNDLIQRELARIEAQAGVQVGLTSLTLLKPNVLHAEIVSVSFASGSLEVRDLEAEFGWFDLIIGRLRPINLHFSRASVRWASSKSHSKTKSDTTESRFERLQNLNRRLARLLRRLPANVYWEELNFYRSDSLITRMPRACIANRKGDALLHTRSDSFLLKLEWGFDWLSIQVHAASRSLDGSEPLSQFVEKFDSIRIRIDLNEENQIRFRGQFDGLRANVNSFHLKPFFLPSTLLELDLTLHEDRFIESIADWRLKNLVGKCSVSIHEGDSSQIQSLKLRVNIPKQPTTSWMSALPPDVFRCLTSLQLTGELGLIFESDYVAERNIPLFLNCKTLTHQLQLQSGGLCELNKLAGTFIYRPWGSSRQLVRGLVGTEGYTALEEISPLLRASVLNAEDGGFFWHQGFNPESLAESMLDNLNRGYFRRGGSTLTMQLVKNVFLGREKTLSRKFEEIALVWLIERFRLCSKERMFEQYLNLIEWGPEIYGIREAADYYFSTIPSQLNALQSIFLASIIPSPRSFRFRFEPGSDTLRSFNQGFFQLIGRKLVEQKYLSPDQLTELDFRKLRLRGRALQAVLKRKPPSRSLPVPEVDWMQLLHNPNLSVDSLLLMPEP